MALEHITGTITDDTSEFKDRKGHRIAVREWSIIAEPNNDIKELITMLKKRQIDAIMLDHDDYITYRNYKLYRSSKEGRIETTEEDIYQKITEADQPKLSGGLLTRMKNSQIDECNHDPYTYTYTNECS